MNASDHSRLRDLQNLGQSVWLDEIYRGMLHGSQFKKWINDGVVGVTSNPAIFAKAFAEDENYREAIAELRKRAANGKQIYEQLSAEDIANAADQLRRTYDQTGKRDGYVSIEVAPRLAHDADGTVQQAQQLFLRIDRPNVMIKVPATDAGLLAIRRIIAAGINVNVTLVFGTRRYQQVAEAYLQGLEDRVTASQPVDGIASVASLFVSRIDTLVDNQLDAISHPDKSARAHRVRGNAAIAVARFAYQGFKTLIASHRWQALAARHAMPQRLLWASTGTKDASYSDVKYVNELVGRETVNTLPMKTLQAFCDHGAAAPTLENDLHHVAALPSELHSLGINLDAVAEQLEREGLEAFAKSMDAMIERLGTA
jgi:transaldolase